MSVALRNLLLTFALAISSLAIAGYLGGTTGYERLIVAMGWPHIILGFVFYFGKVLRGERLARSSFFLLMLLTLVFWATHYTYTITGLISIYFTYHVFRDEVFIYHQKRARHRLRRVVHVAGFIPFILLMFIATDPRPQYYRQDLRRADLDSAQLATDGWTLISFEPISYSRGWEFYFYMNTPQLKGMSGYTTLATVNESRSDGEIRVADRRWPQAADLVFKPYYMGDPNGQQPDTGAFSGNTIPVAIAGDYRLGQTFKAERDHLAGIWIQTRRNDQQVEPARFVFHLTPDTSLPLPPLSGTLQILRYALIAILLGLVLWQSLPHFKENRAFWFYFAILIAIFALLQKGIRAGGGAGYEFPVMFQLIVVFHYWSWYVFSFDKLHAVGRARAVTLSKAKGFYDRMLASLGNLKTFTLVVVALNLISVAGLLWFSKLQGPAGLRYLFDYNYFLYFLVFHVTFSFAPKQASNKTSAPVPAAEATPSAMN